MTTDSSYARRSAVHHQVDERLEQAQALAGFAVPVSPDDFNRMGNLWRAIGDISEALGCGQPEIENELAMAQAVLQEWQEHRAEMVARCCCPLQEGVPVEHRFVNPHCPAHGEQLS